ncbi:tRNA (adenosine(37)-N6)-threonylcarbamoyltransferase complex ATPase subunit type 1 TsaE [Crocinitomix catalasitica]|uniref:tRNA (adenosine(37)-N6)-threonylcarbamoyltransferase complex ATPase subunit type 1 TsaE n=1 Tax=Crocinitomix catalasitica TaxID=184607 RepID=UPI000485591D|nr:tRNA (adenosine(37)-N6)-threonylcarbamoyltransferase complex ATPase subunit type 1 TsaE [Crocinitomix catalasitica]
MQIRVPQLEDLPEASRIFLEQTKGHKSFAFYGSMGAGKTTFITAVLKEMQIEDHVSSPTFSIVNEYFSLSYGKVYHFDFYRIEDEMEAYDIGVEEIFEEDAYCFIEWPERIDNLLPEKCVNVNIHEENGCRIIEINT